MSMPMRNNPYKQYQKQGVLTANPGELIVMLYDACIKNMKLAEIFVGEKNYEGANKAYIKAQDIMTELVSSLNYDYEIAEQLLRIYDFVIRQLVESNIKKDASLLPDLVEIMGELREAWVQIKSAGIRNSAIYTDDEAGAAELSGETLV